MPAKVLKDKKVSKTRVFEKHMHKFPYNRNNIVNPLLCNTNIGVYMEESPLFKMNNIIRKTKNNLKF